MLTKPWQGIISSKLDAGSDVIRAMASDGRLFRAISGFMFDDPGGKTFVCFGTFGAMLIGAVSQDGSMSNDSIVWVPDWTDPKTAVAKLNPTSKKIVALVDRIDDGYYPPQCWLDVSREIRFTPTTISEVKCVIDSRSPAVSALSIEASQLVSVEAMMTITLDEKSA